MRMFRLQVSLLCAAIGVSPILSGLGHASNFKTLHTFDGSKGAQPQGGLINVGQFLYGSAPNSDYFGLVFSLSLGGIFKVLHNFDTPAGGGPNSLPTLRGGDLYGSADDGTQGSQGSDFRIPLSGGGGVLYSFGEKSGDGAYPSGGLTKVNSLFYGVTSAGGSHNCGTVYLMTDKGKEAAFYSFACGSDGATPKGGLLEFGGLLYGTTKYGGLAGICKKQLSVGCGTIFSISPAGTKTTLHEFRKREGAGPLATMIRMGKRLYGTASFGGGGKCAGDEYRGCGTVYSIKIDGSGFKVLHAFQDGDDGAMPESPLLKVGGLLYSTTSQGGVNGGGTIFSIDPKSGIETVLYALSGDEAGPSSGLLYMNGSFFGETVGNGRSGLGVIYQFTP